MAVALALLGIVGVGNSIMDVAAFTLVQRAVADEVLARVFGVIQMLWWLALAFGALVAPALVGWLGIRTALVVTGSALVVLVALLWRPLRAIDARAVAPEATELRILASVPIFAPLPGMSLEHLAGRLVPLRVDSGTVIVRQGDEGDRFYMLVEGNRPPPGPAEDGDRYRQHARRPVCTRSRRFPRRGHRPRAERAGGGRRRERAPCGPADP